jgi:hypothetical protein
MELAHVGQDVSKIVIRKSDHHRTASDCLAESQIQFVLVKRHESVANVQAAGYPAPAVSLLLVVVVMRMVWGPTHLGAPPVLPASIQAVNLGVGAAPCIGEGGIVKRDVLVKEPVKVRPNSLASGTVAGRKMSSVKDTPSQNLNNYRVEG